MPQGYKRRLSGYAKDCKDWNDHKDSKDSKDD
jgi:hypothetical protein